MTYYVVLVLISLAVSTQSLPPRIIASKESICYPFSFVSREEWNARPPKSISTQNLPVPLVVIHHTYIPRACYSQSECSRSMRAMQDTHMITNGWADIGYNFAVGSDGVVYEGRGWNRVGAHAVGYNVNSVGIVLIGDWVSAVPPKHQLDAVKDLINVGIELGYISLDYKLIGHRQVGATECPGEALFNEINKWDRFTHAL
ncbi:peptidoglycan-recognition protein LB-like [Zerene cesonia]|uniref:peptidoglycan-recognition protein LB-like n=1 Tax=Zerene cesonia TaxID=33412 RepID=UPI0018E54FDB|nr:peptidoglycan-recognition protein LB-like [Zerene cesonia]